MLRRYEELTQRLTWIPEVDEDSEFACLGDYAVAIVPSPSPKPWGWELTLNRHVGSGWDNVQVAYGWEATKADAKWRGILALRRYLVAEEVGHWQAREHYGKQPGYEDANWWKVANGL